MPGAPNKLTHSLRRSHPDGSAGRHSPEQPQLQQNLRASLRSPGIVPVPVIKHFSRRVGLTRSCGERCAQTCGHRPGEGTAAGGGEGGGRDTQAQQQVRTRLPGAGCAPCLEPSLAGAVPSPRTTDCGGTGTAPAPNAPGACGGGAAATKPTPPREGRAAHPPRPRRGRKPAPGGPEGGLTG